jgi:hypothetical protein
MTSVKVKGRVSTSANSKSAKNKAKIQGARKKNAKIQGARKSRNAGGAKARMQKHEIEGPKKSAKSFAMERESASAKTQKTGYI